MGKDDKSSNRTTLWIAIIGAIATVLTALIAAFGPVLGNRWFPTPVSVPTVETLAATVSAGDANWAVTYGYVFPSGYWTNGQHAYTLELSCPFSDDPDFRTGTWSQSFKVSQTAQMISGTVYLRKSGLMDDILHGNPVSAINPSQNTAASFSFTELTESQAKGFGTNCEITIKPDNHSAYTLVAGLPYQP